MSAGHRSARVVAWALVIVVATVALAVSVVLFGPRANDYLHHRPFDPSGWRSPSAKNDPNWPARLRMVDDLISRKLLDGLTRAQVEQMLGPGDVTEKWRDWDLVDYLGPERGWIRIDSEWLVIRFAASSGQVARYSLVRD